MQKTYTDGLNDAWELVKHLYCDITCGELSRIFNLDEINSFDDEMAKILKNYTPQEVFEKLTEIKVGDVVYNDDTMEEGIVTYIKDDEIYMLYDDGSSGLVKGNLTKTGKHIDIQKILKQIAGE